MPVQTEEATARQVVHSLTRVMIADDSSLAREIMKKGVKSQHSIRYLEVCFAKDGMEALSMLKENEIHLAFLDINMPGMGAKELIAALQDTRSKDCMVVAVSSNLDHKSEKVLANYQAYHFMQKPFKSGEIADVYHTYLAITRTYSVLIVDDSATMRKLAQKVFEKSRFNFEIRDAGGAEEAIKKIKERPPHIVITDFNMPNIDGLELAGAIHHASDKIAIYMMSTNKTSYLERSAAFVGVTGFLGKPFFPEDIESIMHNLLGLDTPRFGKTRNMFSFLDRNAAAKETA
ncbi:response regulator [uncultured Cohaesibacter sp.]|uniref:response regulator n=1 Tax=uncultured Cohaesibacter sp. TaxID=1002546 RepID=UPI0029C61E4F|nr:response regulator [uncultured Cohaesibacter sp.]